MASNAARASSDSGHESDDGEDLAPVIALRELAKARRRNRAARVDVFEGFYQAYLTAFGCGVAVLIGSDAIGDQRATVAQVTKVVTHGPGFVGLAIALIFAVAVRSGSRGGPLVLPAADVRHVLLAPVPRGNALRSPAVHQVRFSAFVGLVAGAGLGVLASHRLPGGVTEWIPVGAGVGAVVGALSAGLALLTCGRRVRPWMGMLVAVALVAWSGLDVYLGRVTSPMGLLGQLALMPIRLHPASFAVLALAAVVILAGVFGLGGMSLEQAERRATLASQIRFALTLQDLRTVVLLRRQLTQEQSRPTPWVQLGPLAPHRRVIWHRDIRGLTRWPGVRIIRLISLGVVAGLCVVGTWAGTTPLIAVGALALFLAGLDALEPLAQDVDHPDLPSSTPAVPGELRAGHAVVPFGVMVLVALIGFGTALAAAAVGVFPMHLALSVGPFLILPAALLGLIGAATSVVMEPPGGGSDLLPAEIAGIKMVARAVWAPALVLLGLTPVLIARSAVHRHMDPGRAALSGSILPLMVGVLGLGWLRYREEIHEYFKLANPPSPAQPAPTPESS